MVCCTYIAYVFWGSTVQGFSRCIIKMMWTVTCSVACTISGGGWSASGVEQPKLVSSSINKRQLTPSSKQPEATMLGYRAMLSFWSCRSLIHKGFTYVDGRWHAFAKYRIMQNTRLDGLIEIVCPFGSTNHFLELVLDTLIDSSEGDVYAALLSFSQQKVRLAVMLESQKLNPAEISVATVRIYILYNYDATHQNVFCHEMLVLNVHFYLVQRSSWEILLPWPLWKLSWQPWHHTLIYHRTTFASSRTSRQARTEDLPSFSCLLLW